jgi:hypothetical protein
MAGKDSLAAPPGSAQPVPSSALSARPMLKSRELNPGLWDISHADASNLAVCLTRHLDKNSEPGSCLSSVEPIHSNGCWLDIGSQTRSRFERPT